VLRSWLYLTHLVVYPQCVSFWQNAKVAWRLDVQVWGLFCRLKIIRMFCKRTLASLESHRVYTFRQTQSRTHKSTDQYQSWGFFCKRSPCLCGSFAKDLCLCGFFCRRALASDRVYVHTHTQTHKNTHKIHWNTQKHTQKHKQKFSDRCCPIVQGLTWCVGMSTQFTYTSLCQCCHLY